ncbi:MAG: SAM-dependent chlorinase/fluorinase [Planctomycetota bacterium]|nr:SAM-dependent chlorinase/fluorinase [Planctomycetota bacterium]
MPRLALALLPLLAACAGAPSPPEGAPVPVVLMTDFGLKDDAVGLLRGVVLARSPWSPVVDLTHAVPAFDVAAGARRLAEAPEVYPPGSVFVVVVDPGVCTRRRALVARLANGTLLVGPDNGVLSLAIERHGPAEVRALERAALMRDRPSDTFHGRDVFAPAAGHLAAGARFEDVGPEVTDWTRLTLPRAARLADGGATGVVTSLDEPFGNVWTNVPADHLEGLEPGAAVAVTVGERRLVATFVRTFGDVPVGQPLVYVNSRGHAALAINMGDFARTHDVQPGQPVSIRPAR